MFDWAIEELTPVIAPHLAPLYRAGDSVVDLCCGTGPVAFMLEAQGAHVTGIDCAPGMIEQARQEAARRGSRVEFIQADVLALDLGVWGTPSSTSPTRSLRGFGTTCTAP
ncbi:MAG: class I SAM-dependent methyltransferase [Planctomycetota bacterium]